MALVMTIVYHNLYYAIPCAKSVPRRVYDIRSRSRPLYYMTSGVVPRANERRNETNDNVERTRKELPMDGVEYSRAARCSVSSTSVTWIA
jgi:hypothetical protein